MIDINKASLWGQLFEVGIKRGILLQLFKFEFKSFPDDHLNEWRGTTNHKVYDSMITALDIIDSNQREQALNQCKHVFLLGMGLGQTVIREYLLTIDKKHPLNDTQLKFLWCPLSLPSTVQRQKDEFEDYQSDLLGQFQKIFQRQTIDDSALYRKGQPVNADFLMVLESDHPKKAREVLCLEFSFNGSGETFDFLSEEEHLRELQRYAYLLNSRGVFSNVCAEVSGEKFILSRDIKYHLSAFTGRDKPFYKLCQAASYVDGLMKWFEVVKLDDRVCHARGISVTQNGMDSVGATYFQNEAADPRTDLVSDLGFAYRNAFKHDFQDEESTERAIKSAFDKIRKALPKVMKEQLLQLKENLPNPGENLSFDFTETVQQFENPMSTFALEDALQWAGDNEQVDSFFRNNAKDDIRQVLKERYKAISTVNLRDLHAAAIIAALQNAKTGSITTLGLEGNPGIGKTSALVRYLNDEKDGFLLLYTSPRVIINDDVSDNLARDKETKAVRNVLTLTTNSKLIGVAGDYYRKCGEEGLDRERFVDSAVVYDGIDNLVDPKNNTLVLKPAEKEVLEKRHVRSNTKVDHINEREREVIDGKKPGVLGTLALTTRTLLDHNHAIDKVVLTAAIQGYRETRANQTTIDQLNKLFKEPDITKHIGIARRAEFAKRISTIVVMVDELTGDQAGSLILKAIHQWLFDQFIEPFRDDTPLFKVILIAADASLGNEVVMDSFINSGDQEPDKVLVSKSIGNQPFSLASRPVIKRDRKKKPEPMLHVMTNSYPAKSLTIDYRIRFNTCKVSIKDNGRKQTAREAITRQFEEDLRNNVLAEILRAQKANAEQIIFFAQDKLFLRDIKSDLVNGKEGYQPLFAESEVEIIDSNVESYERKRLIEDARRDSIKVFLITSSAARGVSFPKTDWIIALMPRFNIESALMEMSQLIYRGRGKHYKNDEGVLRDDGDFKDRNLVMLLQDFLVHDEDGIDKRRWLRQVSDLLTYLVMIRSTIYTRITGDAGLEKQQLSIVPVGGIDSSEMLSLMATSVREFVKEVSAIIREKKYTDEKGVLQTVSDAIINIFGKYRLDAWSKKSDVISFISAKPLREFASYAANTNMPLLISPKDNPKAVLPDNIYCGGPFWLESWKDYDIQEQFMFEWFAKNVGSQYESLMKQFYAISEDKHYPFKLRNAASDLYKIFHTYNPDSNREYSTIKAIKSQNTWVAIPIDYQRFWRADEEGRFPRIDGEAWRDALGGCIACKSSESLPVIARYAENPYVAFVGTKDPLKFSMLFDDRYLSVSHELNLLNTILLSER